MRGFLLLVTCSAVGSTITESVNCGFSSVLSGLSGPCDKAAMRKGQIPYSYDWHKIEHNSYTPVKNMSILSEMEQKEKQINALKGEIKVIKHNSRIRSKLIGKLTKEKGQYLAWLQDQRKVLAVSGQKLEEFQAANLTLVKEKDRLARSLRGSRHCAEQLGSAQQRVAFLERKVRELGDCHSAPHYVKASFEPYVNYLPAIFGTYCTHQLVRGLPGLLRLPLVIGGGVASAVLYEQYKRGSSCWPSDWSWPWPR